MSKKPVPPKLSPKPGMVKVYKALYSYTAQQSDELSFAEGDSVYVSDQSETGWWRATIKGKSGLVPSNYVAEDISKTIDFPMHEAAKRGNLPFMEECLQNKIPINAQDKAGNTPLFWASHGGHIDCVEALLDNNLIMLNSQNRLGETCLHAAAWKRHPQVIEMLLKRGMDDSIKNKEGKTALELATDPACKALLKPKTARATDNSQDDYLDDSGSED